jgi:hypothetical protein
VLKKIVIVAEHAAGAGLTENAGFPMMKTREKLDSPRRHPSASLRAGSGTEKSKIFDLLVSLWLCAFVVK